MSDQPVIRPEIQEPAPVLGGSSLGQLLPAISTSLVVGLLEVVLAMSFATLVFGQALGANLGRAIGLVLFGGALNLALISLLSSLRGTVGGIQDVPAAILSLAAAGIIAALPPGASPGQVTATVLAGMVTATLLTGLALTLLGVLKLGNLVRFLPYPVVGGFLAGTGWLLVTGAISTMTGLDTNGTGLFASFSAGMLIRWVPGLLFALAFYALSLHYSHYLLLPGAILGGVLAFYLAAWLLGYPPAELSAMGWLMGPFPQGGLWQPPLPSELSQVNWLAILRQAPNILTLVLMSAIGLLLNSTGLELATNQDADLNRDLRAAGLSNLVGGLFGSLPGYQQLSASALTIKYGGGSRLAGLFGAAVPLAVLFFGGAALSIVPKFIVGGLIFALGIDFLHTWVYQAWQNFPRLDYAILVGILLVIATVGFMPGIAVGLAAVLVMFVINYSRIDVVRNLRTGENYRSRVTRPPNHQQILRRSGDQLLILNLQGFLFFGTAHTLLERLRDRLLEPSSPVCFILLDFQQVTGMDSTSVLSFRKIEQLASNQDARLLVASAAPAIRHSLSAGGFGSQPEVVHWYSDVDYALEWYEENLLASAPAAPVAANLRELILAQVQADQLPLGVVDDLLDCLERLDLPAGQVLIRQGDQPETMYFLETGQLTALTVRPDGQTIRLQTMFGGQVVGEVGFYLDIARTADVVADAPSVVYVISRQALQELESAYPQSAAVLHRLIVQLLAERVAHLTRVVNALQS